MEILFMVFMVIVSIMALFAVMVVFRDVVKEILLARRERNATANVAQQTPVAEPVVEQAVEEPVEAPVEVVEETAEETVEEPVEEEVAITEEDDGKISFSAKQQQTLDEKYLALSSEAKNWYDEIIKYASAVENSKRYKNARYEEYKVGKNRLVRLLIKRGVINCEFILHNSDFRNYVQENKISVKQSATTMLVEDATTVDAVKNSIDIVVSAIAEEKEYKKQLAREKRRAARANSKAVAEETETENA